MNLELALGMSDLRLVALCSRYLIASLAPVVSRYTLIRPHLPTTGLRTCLFLTTGTALSSYVALSFPWTMFSLRASAQFNYDLPLKGATPSFYPLFISNNSVLAVLIIALVWAVLPLFFRKNVTNASGNPIPPGPLLRYAFLRKYPERALRAWSKKYGPLFSVWMGNQLFVVISDARIARDLLVTNGSIFSSRRQYFMKNQTILNGRAITASAYDDRWWAIIFPLPRVRISFKQPYRRQHRRIASQLLTPKAMSGYAAMIDYEAHMMIRTLSNVSMRGMKPVNPSHWCFRYTFK